MYLYFLTVLCGLFFTAAEIFFMHYYQEKKISFDYKKLFSTYKKQVIIIAICNTVISILGTIFYDNKGYSIATLFKYLILMFIVFLIAVIDTKTKKIPNMLVLFLLIARLIFLVFEMVSNNEFAFQILKTSLIGFAVAAVLMLVCMLVSRGGVGGGDVKIYSVLGFYFGLTGIIQILFYSLLLACIVSIFNLVTKRLTIKDSLPMAPFIFGGLIAYFVLI